MENFISKLFENLQFEIVTVAVVVALALLAVYALWALVQKKFPRTKPNSFKVIWQSAIIKFFGNRWNKKLDRKSFKKGRWLGRRILFTLKKLILKPIALIVFILNTIHFILSPRRKVLLVLTPIITVLSLLSIYNYFGIRPYVISQNPTADVNWQRATEPLVFTFDRPIKASEIKLNFAPELEGDIEFVPAFAGLESLNLYRQIRFYPKTSVDPDIEQIVYVVGIENLSSAGGRHEHNATFKTGKNPAVVAQNIADQAVNVAVESNLVFDLSDSDSEFVEWNLKSTPEVAAQIKRYEGNKLTIDFTEPLKQTTTYNFVLSNALVKRELKTGEILNAADLAFISKKELSFTTVKAPLIKSLSPQGHGIFPNTTIVFAFDIQMKPETVESKITTSPEFAYTTSWNETSDTLTLTPAQNLAKDTEFTIEIAKGLSSLDGGLTEQPIKNTFRTVGPIGVVAINPGNGAGGVDPGSWISITFDQPVDRASAQASFSISPGVQGQFVWESDNKMHYQTTSRMSYGTRYTVKLAAGLKAVHGIDLPAEFASAFTTRAEVISLNVPYYRQQESYTCNVAAIRMALAYRGVYLSEAQIKSGIGVGPSLSGSTGGDPYSQWINGHGTYWGPASRFLGNYRSNSVMRNWNVTDLLNEVARGNPVIVWWQNGWGEWYWKSWTTPGGATVQGLNGMHSEVVVGFRGPASNPSSITTLDPWRGRRTYTKAAFDSLWSRSFSRTAIIVR